MVKEIIGAVSLLAIIIGMLISCIRSFNKEYDVRLVGHPLYDEKKKKLTFTGAYSGKQYVYYGSCSVWRDEYGKRCDVSTERKLCDIWFLCTHFNKQDDLPYWMKRD